ncbi:MAG: hypothetical protein ACLFNZ_12185, partial [Spirochaetaceae bacterium]
GVLIDPGSKLDFEEVYRKVTSVLPPESLKYIVLLHQDSDIASSVPLFEERGFPERWQPTGGPPSLRSTTE